MSDKRYFTLIGVICLVTTVPPEILEPMRGFILGVGIGCILIAVIK